MKVFPFKIPKSPNENLILQIDKEPTFYSKLHQHEEIQISYIVKGSGTLFIGDSVHTYSAGNLIAIGSQVPHVFRSDTAASPNAHMISLFFTVASFGNDFFQLSEFAVLQAFFTKVGKGIRASKVNKKMQESILNLHKKNPLQRFTLLLNLLEYLSTIKIKSLSSFIYPKEISAADGKRMQVIFEYALNYFNEELSLAQIASKIHMTPHAFCRYFKQRTNKTFFQFINELRIEYACKQLLNQPELPISEIALMAGFNNLSHFNRTFKSLKKITPRAYRNSNSSF